MLILTIVIISCLCLVSFYLRKKKNIHYRYKTIAIDLAVVLLVVVAVKLVTTENRGTSSQVGNNVERWVTLHGYKVEKVVENLSVPIAVSLFHQTQGISRFKFLFSDLRGQISGVTNSNEVVNLAYAQGTYQPIRDLSIVEGQAGQTGLCIAPDNKFVFSTGAITRGSRRLNRIIKWELQRDDKLTKVKELIFTDIDTGAGHQIGHCLITQKNKLLFGTGDGLDTYKVQNTHDVNKSNGKIMRLSLDLTAPKDNPFYNKNYPDRVSGMVYASGLRNPFAIAETEGGLYAADNGHDIDRLIKVKKGEDYPYDGHNISFIYNNLLTWPTPVGPADMIYIDKNNTLFPYLRGHLIVVASFRRALIAVPVNDSFGITGNPRTILFPAGEYFDITTPRAPSQRASFNGLALGADEIYISHVRNFKKPQQGEILKLVPSKNSVAQRKIIPHGDVVFDMYQCRGCHRINGRGAGQAPRLDNVFSTVKDRLQSEDYFQKLSLLADQVYDEASNARQEVLAAMKKLKTDGNKEEFERVVRLWITTKLKYPKFYDKNHVMPSVELEKKEIEAIIDELLRKTD